MEALKVQGNTFFTQKDYGKAIDLYTEALAVPSRDPNDPAAAAIYSNRSAAYLHLTDLEKALSDTEECIRLRPDWFKGYVRRAAVFDALDRETEAMQDYQKALSLDSTVTDIQPLMARLRKKSNQKVMSDRATVLTMVRGNGLQLRRAGEVFLNDPEIVATAVTQDGRALQFASQQLKNDKHVVMLAVTQNGISLQHAGPDFKKDVEIVRAAVSSNGAALRYADPILHGDREIATLAVQTDGLSLQYVSDALRGDKSIVLLAVAQNGAALEFAGIRLRGDKEVVMVAVHQDGYNGKRHASASLQMDPEVVAAADKQMSSKGTPECVLS